MRKGVPVNFKTRPLSNPSECAEAFGDILTAIGRGELTPDEGNMIGALIERRANLFQTIELQDEIAYWVKQNKASEGFFTGLGYWTRANPEQCLLATRGKPGRLAKDVRRLVVAPRREHSRKPDQIRELIERLVQGPYLELFARETKPGWDCWGNQVGIFDAGEVNTRRQPSRLVGAQPRLHAC